MRLFALCLALCLLAACAADVPPTVQVNRTQPPTQTQVVIAFPQIPTHFDPVLGFGGGGHGGGHRLLFSTLVDIAPDMSVIPGLAYSYAVCGDALTYAFTLRTGVYFTDGAPVTAADVVFSFEEMMRSPTGIDLTMVADVAASGDTVSITLRNPMSTFILNVAQVAILPQHAYGPGFALAPIGSGPFTLAQFDAGQQFILEANPAYHGQIPLIARAVFVQIGDENARLAAVRSGTVDIAPTSPILAGVDIPGYHLLVAETVDNLGIVLPTIPNTGERNRFGYPVGCNIGHERDFRRAIAHGIDREAIVRYALNGFGRPAFSENDGLPWSNPQSVIEHDIAYAVSLLEGLGWQPGADGIREREGVRASLPLLYPAGDSARQAVGMAVTQQAREALGIEFAVTGLSWDEIATRMFSQPLMLAWGSLNPMTSFYLFHSSRAGLDDFFNPQNFRSAVVDAHLERAVAARTLEEAAVHFRAAQWDGSTGTSMRGECPYIFLINKQHLYWVRDGLYTGRRRPHGHGSAWPLVHNLGEWRWAQ